MRKVNSVYLFYFVIISFCGCKKNNDNNSIPPPHPFFHFNSLRIDGILSGNAYYGVNTNPAIKFSFSTTIDPNSVSGAVSFKNNSGASIAFNTMYESGDSTIVIQPASSLGFLTPYVLSVSTALKSKEGGTLQSAVSVNFTTSIDSSDKFPVISDDSLLTLVQQQTFKYFWDFGHPVSGLARERNSSGETVTTGGSGFGIMTIPVAINRNFITRAEGLARVQQVVSFLKNTAQHFHGAFSHWMNGTTGAVVPFAQNDDGADIVETSYMMMGLLTARQYFDVANIDEANLRNDINDLWNGVEWDWFRQNGRDVLYWNWSPDYDWAVNVPVQGWNETLITYVLAASSTTHGIPKTVYDSGFARNGAMKNGNLYYGYALPLGEANGGPLFFEHYSFLGIDPNGLSDAYANYQTQTLNHTKINYEYCKANPKNFYGYSNLCWGLTASDIQGGYTASSPTNDVGVIAPTAAISSMAYTPTESMEALKFFYYKLGDKIWGQYGFNDAFNLNNGWFADSYLAIDEGPIIVMIENYRTGLLWNLFTSCPEIKSGLLSLGFSAPYL
ncbi:MAG: glucoamylase family protein [Chitinophagales bacterium]